MGFRYSSIDRRDRTSLLDSMIPADIHVLVGDAALGEISYGVRLLKAELIDDEGNAEALPRFQQTDPTYSNQGVLSRPPWLGGSGKLGLLEFAQTRLMDIHPGETLKIQQLILLGGRADVASVTDQFYTGAVLTVAFRDSRDRGRRRSAAAKPLPGGCRATTAIADRARIAPHR